MADEALLDEVTPWSSGPSFTRAASTKGFLDVPQECLVLSMKQHQKYFPLTEPASGKLLPRFSSCPISTRPIQQRRCTATSACCGRGSRMRSFSSIRTERCGSTRAWRSWRRVVYHNKLGTQLERVERISA